ncbi:MAG: hypothetical protein CMF23_12565 [Ignavibacteriae bacterium]|nr:hypothetical protein [Ignavibacteriota bacterium]
MEEVMKTRIGISLLLFIVMLFVSGCGGGSSDPKDIVINSMEMIENNNVSGVSEILSKDVKSLVDSEKLEKAVAEESEKIKSKGGIAKIEFTDEKVEENQIDYKYTITYGDGSTKNDKARLVKEDGEWKLGMAKN